MSLHLLQYISEEVMNEKFASSWGIPHLSQASYSWSRSNITNDPRKTKENLRGRRLYGLKVSNWHIEVNDKCTKLKLSILPCRRLPKIAFARQAQTKRDIKKEERTKKTQMAPKRGDVFESNRFFWTEMWDFDKYCFVCFRKHPSLIGLTLIWNKGVDMLFC